MRELGAGVVGSDAGMGKVGDCTAEGAQRLPAVLPLSGGSQTAILRGQLMAAPTRMTS